MLHPRPATEPTDMPGAPVRARVRTVVGIGLPLVAAAVSMAINGAVPLLSALLLAIALGAVAANAGRRVPGATAVLPRAEAAAKHMLRAGIVLLGLSMSLTDLAAIGWQGLVLVLATVGTTFLVTVRVGRRLGIAPALATLVAAGFSICGAAAIAAVSDTVRAKGRDVGLAVAMVTIFGTAMIAVVPWLSHLLGLSEHEAALWAGASIHEVAQVVAAGSVIGGGALATATTVKLARVVMVAPVSAIVKRRHGSHGGAPVPWFVIGFVAAVLVRTAVPLPTTVLDGAHLLSTLLLAAGMFGLGLAVRVKELWPVPGRVLALGALATGVAAGVSLLVVVLW